LEKYPKLCRLLQFYEQAKFGKNLIKSLKKIYKIVFDAENSAKIL